MKFRLFPDPPEPSGPESWRRVAWPAIKQSVTWYFFVGLAVAMLAPRALVSQSSSIQLVIEFVSTVVPALSKFSAISDFPEVTGFYFAVMWLLSPIPTLLVAFRWPPPPRPKFKQTIGILARGPVAVGVILAVFFILPIPEGFAVSYRRGQGIAFLALMSQYRVGLGGLGSMVFAILVGSSGVWLKFVWANVFKLAAMLRTSK